MTRRLTLAVLCVAAAACGGSGSGGNAAASREFNYGSPSAADSSQTSATQGSLTSALALQSSAQPSVSDAQGVAQFSGVTTALLGSPLDSFSALTGTSSSAQARALTVARSSVLSSASFDDIQFDGSCVVTTPTSVTLNGCTVHIDEVDGSTTVTGTVTANGSATLTNSNQTLTWDVTVTADVNVSASEGSGSGGLRYHAAGTLTAIAPTASAPGTIDGDMTAELDAHATMNGQSASIGVDESLALNDVTYQTDPVCVTGGTVEAKRVWTSWNVPGGHARPSDKAALVTFTGTGCSTATVQLSM